jgi:dTDP-L-rhamnose 4-epimerase
MSLPYNKILVTGGAGFIGSFLVDALIRQGYRVVVFDNLEPQVHNGRIPPYLHPEAEFVCGDIRDYDAVKKVTKDVEAVFHEAAMVGVGQSMFQVKKYVDVNSAGTANLLDVLANEPHKVRKMIVASSMSIYGEGLYRTPGGQVIDFAERLDDDLAAKRWNCFDPGSGEELKPCPTPETKPLGCASIYAITKKNQEEQILVFGKTHRIPAVALRYFNTYGPRQSLNNPYTGVAAIFLNRIKCGQPLMIFEDGQQQRDFVSVHDIVQANLLALEKPEADYEFFNVGSGAPISIKTLGELLMKECGASVPLDIVGKFRKGDIRNCYADITKIQNRLGYNPRVTLAAGLRELIETSANEICDEKADFRMDYLASRKLVI